MWDGTDGGSDAKPRWWLVKVGRGGVAYFLLNSDDDALHIF